MNKQLKAELFRLRKTGNYFIYMLLGAVLLFWITVLETLNSRSADLSTALGEASPLVMLLLMVVPPVIAVISGQLYNSGKPGYYEIMAGNSPRSIIMSKIVVDGGLWFLLLSVSTTAIYIYMGLKNGLGSFDKPILRIALYLIVLAQIVAGSIMIMMSVHSPGTGAAVAWLRFMIFDSVLLPFFMWFAREILGQEGLATHIAYLSVMNKLLIILYDKINIVIILHVVLGFIAEFVIWYLTITHEMKKCNY